MAELEGRLAAVNYQNDKLLVSLEQSQKVNLESTTKINELEERNIEILDQEAHL